MRWARPFASTSRSRTSLRRIARGSAGSRRAALRRRCAARMPRPRRQATGRRIRRGGPFREIPPALQKTGALDAQRVQTRVLGAHVAGLRRQLALHDGEHVLGDQRAKPRPAVVELRHDLRLQILADGGDELAGRRAVADALRRLRRCRRAIGRRGVPVAGGEQCEGLKFHLGGDAPEAREFDAALLAESRWRRGLHQRADGPLHVAEDFVIRDAVAIDGAAARGFVGPQPRLTIGDAARRASASLPNRHARTHGQARSS